MKITIITATYNSAATVRDTMESVLRQTHRDVDYIVVDGASTDSTMDIVRQYEPKFEGRMRWISEPDKGIYDAMNKGLAMAQGDVVGLLNSDDFYSSDDILAAVNAAFEEDKELDAVYGDVHYVKAENVEVPARYYSSRMFRRSWMRFGFMPAHPSFYCKRECYEKYGGFDTSFRVAADFENLLRLIFVNRIRTRYINRDFVTMRTGGASSSGLKSHKQIMRDHLRGLKKNGIRSNILFLSSRYIYKIGEVLWSKLRLSR